MMELKQIKNYLRSKIGCNIVVIYTKWTGHFCPGPLYSYKLVAAFPGRTPFTIRYPSVSDAPAFPIRGTYSAGIA